MKYLALCEDDLTTLTAALIQQKRNAKSGIKSEVGVFIQLDKVDKFIKDEISRSQLFDSGQVVGSTVAIE